MNEFFEVLKVIVSLVLSMFITYRVFQIVDIIALRKRIKSYNKRYHANLDTSFKDIKKISKDYNDWYLQYFVPDKCSKFSLFEATFSDCEEERKNMMGGYYDEE